MNQTTFHLPKDFAVLDLGAIKGKTTFPVEVEFDASPEVVAEHLVASNRRDLLPLLSYEEDGKQIIFSNETGERLEIPLPDPKAKYESQNMTQLAVVAKELGIESKGLKKGELIDAIMQAEAKKVEGTTENTENPPVE